MHNIELDYKLVFTRRFSQSLYYAHVKRLGSILFVNVLFLLI